jgi:hypothetical protein
LQDGGGDGGDVGSRQRGLDKMEGMPDTGHQDLGWKSVIFINSYDIANDIHADMGMVV